MGGAQLTITVPSLDAEHLQVEECRCLVTISDIEVMPRNNLAASVTHGYIRLEGPMCRIRWMQKSIFGLFQPPESSRLSQWRSDSWKVDGKTMTMPSFEDYLDHHSYSTPRRPIYHFVPFFETRLLHPKETWLTGMILQPTGQADGEYRRRGVLNIINEKARAMIKAGIESQFMAKEEYEKVSTDGTYTIRIV